MTIYIVMIGDYGGDDVDVRLLHKGAGARRCDGFVTYGGVLASDSDVDWREENIMKINDLLNDHSEIARWSRADALSALMAIEAKLAVLNYERMVLEAEVDDQAEFDKLTTIQKRLISRVLRPISSANIEQVLQDGVDMMDELEVF